MAESARINPMLALTITLLALPAMALAAPADLDPGFGQNGKLTLDDSELARALALQPDGKILVAGDAPTNSPADRDGVVYRLNQGGSLDQTFALGGARRLEGMNGGALALALQPDGKLLAAGYTSSDAIVYRLNADGTFDQSFDGDGVAVIDSGGIERVYALALQPDGKILVSGETYSTNTADSDPVVYRLNPAGTPDGGFGSGGTFRIEGGASETAYALAMQPDGKVLVAGRTTVDDSTDGIAYRLNANGTLDDGFGPSGRFRIDEGRNEYALALVLQPDGRILVAGYTSTTDGTVADGFVHRLLAGGTPDPAFGQDGRLRIDDAPRNAGFAAALQPDGKILVAGFTAVDDSIDAAVYRLNANGSRDLGFVGDGVLRIDNGGGEVADAIAVQQDGKIVVAGVTISGLAQRSMVYRLQGGNPVPLSPATSASPATAPVLGRLRISPSVFRAAGRGASVSFTLDRAASVRFSIARADRGRRVDGRCVRPTRSNRGKRRCTRYRLLRGGFTRRGLAGANRFRLTSRINARRLRPARYRLIATPVAEGRRGDTKHTLFRIKP